MVLPHNKFLLKLYEVLDMQSFYDDIIAIKIQLEKKIPNIDVEKLKDTPDYYSVTNKVMHQIEYKKLLRKLKQDSDIHSYTQKIADIEAAEKIYEEISSFKQSNYAKDKVQYENYIESYLYFQGYENKNICDLIEIHKCKLSLLKSLPFN